MSKLPYSATSEMSSLVAENIIQSGRIRYLEEQVAYWRSECNRWAKKWAEERWFPDRTAAAQVSSAIKVDQDGFSPIPTPALAAAHPEGCNCAICCPYESAPAAAASPMSESQYIAALEAKIAKADATIAEIRKHPSAEGNWVYVGPSGLVPSGYVAQQVTADGRAVPDTPTGAS